MTLKKTHRIRVQQRPSQRVGVHSRALIRASKENMNRLGALSFYCNQCARWLPALAFYEEVTLSESDLQQEGGIPNGALYLARYELKAEGLKGHDRMTVCEDCAERANQD
jgi:hypothetical protein